MLRRLVRGINALKRLPRAMNRKVRALTKALRSSRANDGNDGPATMATAETNERGSYGDDVGSDDASSVTSGSSCATIPSRQYSYGNHWYPTGSETSTDHGEDSDDSVESPRGYRPAAETRGEMEENAYDDVRPESEGLDETDGSDSDSDCDSVHSECSESSGVTIPLHRTKMFDPSNRRFDPTFSSRYYLTRGGHETVAREEYSYMHRYYRTFSEMSLENDD